MVLASWEVGHFGHLFGFLDVWKCKCLPGVQCFLATFDFLYLSCRDRLCIDAN